MIKSFWTNGEASKIQPTLRGRVMLRLQSLDGAKRPEDMNLPGFNFHPLRGKPQRYTVHVNGPWCITFGWDGKDATDIDLENYH